MKKKCMIEVMIFIQSEQTTETVQNNLVVFLSNVGLFYRYNTNRYRNSDQNQSLDWITDELSSEHHMVE